MSVDNRVDVFLSYSSRDHVPVEVVARWLRDQGLKVFQALGTCCAAAMFVGSREMGDWQQREQYVALEGLVRDSTFLVIPVLLPQADPGLRFLVQNTWVDLREQASRRPRSVRSPGGGDPRRAPRPMTPVTH